MRAKTPEQAEFERLLDTYGSRPRKQRTDVCFDSYAFTVPDGLSFIYQYREIFADCAYAITPQRDRPIIYDCGANIGMAALFFCSRYPQAKVVAFEADPEIAALAQGNLERNGAGRVEMHKAAVAVHDGTVHFFPDGSDGGNTFSGTNGIEVPAIRLRSFLDREPYVDLLKMDIEGQELAVLQDCADLLHKIDQVFVEYHSRNQAPQHLHEILGLLSAKGFRYFTTCNSMRKAPFLNRAGGEVFDLLVNIWAYR